MDDRVLKELLRRIGKLERESVRVRIGLVTDDSPLSVELGASPVALTDLVALDSTTPAIDDRVAVAVWGNDLLVLGVLP